MGINWDDIVAVKEMMEGGTTVRRYNYFVRKSVDELKLGGEVGKAKVYAMLANAEASMLMEFHET